jgi:hypothetical protein
MQVVFASADGVGKGEVCLKVSNHSCMSVI